MIVEMVRVAVWGIGSEKDAIVEELHELGMLHLDIPNTPPLASEELKGLRLLGATILGMVEALGWKEWDKISDEALLGTRGKIRFESPEVVDEIAKSLEEFKRRLHLLIEERSSLMEMLRSLRMTHQVAYHFQTFLEEEMSKGKCVSIWRLDHKSHARALSQLRSRLKVVTSPKERPYLSHHSVQLKDNEAILAISVDPQGEEIAEDFMRLTGGMPWHPPDETRREGLLKSIEALEEKLSWVPKRLKSIDEELERCREEWGPHLAALYFLIEEKLDQLTVKQLAVKENGGMFVIEGWIPAEVLETLTARLKERFNGRILIQWRYPSSEEWHEVPTALDNPSQFKPFEIFLKLLPVPRYDEMDPTALIAIFFPFFAGCMVGDIGYAVIMGVLGWLLRRKCKRELWRDIGSVIIHMACWSAFWGVAFGELFGDLGHRLIHMEPLWVERSQAVLPVISFSVGLGVVHVLLGLFVGFLRGLRHKDNHMWMERLANILLITALIIALVHVKGWLPKSFFTLSVSITIVGLLLLLKVGFLGGLVETIGAVGNILSYVRIAAIGLSSAILAVVASRFVDALGVSFIGIFLALSIHLLNLILAVAGSGLHAARLHYVEFLGKFYKGGGKEYKPFARKRGSLVWKRR